MAILGNRNSLIEDEIPETEDYTVPAVFRHDEKEMSLKKSIILSTILHPAVVGVGALILVILTLLGITIPLFNPPKPKVNDIEFVLVDNAKNQKPLHKTNLRSDRNTRTGGHTDKKRPVSMPSPSPAKKSVQHKSTPTHNTEKHVAKPIQPKNIFKSFLKPMSAPQARPRPPSARPSIKPPSIPRPTLRPTSPFAVPIPKSGSIPHGKYYSTGPIGGHGTAASGSSSSGSGRSFAPVPSLAPTSGGGSSSGSRLSRGGSGYSNQGNPGGGGGAPGVDSIREPDFGPYMRELQRRIKMNWEPPKGNESKRVVLLFKIAKDGRLLSLRVLKSSGVPSADKAALSAVELTAPFKRLPPEFKGASIDIQFTFDYNVFSASQY